jgi:alpha-tubulin suppressor-like RCC1 family protein
VEGVVRFGAACLLTLAAVVGPGRPTTGAQSAPPDRYARDSIALVSITAGDRFTCGLTAEGRAYCWGANQYGQLGAPASADRCEVQFLIKGSCSLRPVVVSGDVRFAAIDAGRDHVCGLTAEREAWCWGRNLSGQLGTADSVESCSVEGLAEFPGYKSEPCSRRPVRVAGGGRFSEIRGGRWTTCALSVNGETYCWGNGASGPFDDRKGGVPTPRLVPDLEPLVSRHRRDHLWNHVLGTNRLFRLLLRGREGPVDGRGGRAVREHRRGLVALLCLEPRS